MRATGPAGDRVVCGCSAQPASGSARVAAAGPSGASRNRPRVRPHGRKHDRLPRGARPRERRRWPGARQRDRDAAAPAAAPFAGACPMPRRAGREGMPSARQTVHVTRSAHVLRHARPLLLPARPPPTCTQRIPPPPPRPRRRRGPRPGEAGPAGRDRPRHTTRRPGLEGPIGPAGPADAGRGPPWLAGGPWLDAKWYGCASSGRRRRAVARGPRGGCAPSRLPAAGVVAHRV